MIFAFDTFYSEDKAKTVALGFESWLDSEPSVVYEETLSGVEEYVPGEFYKRELPCILSLLRQISETPSVLIVDGFVFLDDDRKLGLGGHLYEALDRKTAVIGVGKTNFATIEKLKIPVCRGESKNPLFVTAIGTDVLSAAENIKNMHGEFRLPTLLKKLDQLTKV